MIEASNPRLLALPLELREQIYKDVLSHPLCGPQLLRTCHEIYTEAHKFLFQRPLVFRGQSFLYNWLEDASPQHLHHVTDIVFELHEVDLKPLLSQATNLGEEEAAPRLLAWELHENDLVRMQQALERLPNVKTLTLRALSERQSFLYRELLGKLLEVLYTIWPSLQSLSLEGNFHHQSLSFLLSLPEIRTFAFDGFSASSETDTALILAGLQHLTSLSLVSQNTLLTPTSHLHSGFTSKRQSFTSHVIHATRQLASFSVTERLHQPPSPALFFTSEILTSIHEHSSLRNLSIALSQAPDAETFEALESFLEESSIARLDLDWPDLTAQVLDTYALLPSCLQYFWVRVSSMAVAFDILWSILESREAGDMPHLRRVVLMRDLSDEMDISDSTAENDGMNIHDHVDDDHPSTNDTDADNVNRAMRRLNYIRVKVLWCTEAS